MPAKRTTSKSSSFNFGRMAEDIMGFVVNAGTEGRDRAKTEIEKGSVLHYEVTAIYLGHSARGPQRALPPGCDLHPFCLRSDFSNLLWGEQFAPVGIEWVLKKSLNWATAPDWDPINHAFTQLFSTRPNPHDWGNQFPD